MAEQASDATASADMVQHRRLRMIRQRQALVTYTTAHLAQVDFPFERRTDPNVRCSPEFKPCKVRFAPSAIFPFTGVFAAHGTISQQVVLDYPGVLMTLHEYKAMDDLLVPTAVDTDLHTMLVDTRWSRTIHARNPIVLVGESDAAGPSVMQIPGKGNVRLTRHDHSRILLSKEGGRFVVPCDWAFVELVGKSIPEGTELCVSSYAPGFMEETPVACDQCFQTAGAKLTCSVQGCTLSYHAECCGTGLASSDPFRCYYHTHFAHLAPKHTQSQLE